MSFGKTLTLCAAVAMLVSCQQKYDFETPEGDLVILAEEPPYVAGNNDYVLSVAMRDEALSPLIKEGNKMLAEYLSDKLLELEHINGGMNISHLEEVISTPSVEYLLRFDVPMLIRTYYVLHALEDPSFRSKIGKELEIDTGVIGEHGGRLHLSTDGKVTVEMIPNVYTCSEYKPECDPDNHYQSFKKKESYGLEGDVLGTFHFHAQNEDMTNIASTLSYHDHHGPLEVVFSRIDGNRFNVDIALIYTPCRPHFVNLDLGVYEY